MRNKILSIGLLVAAISTSAISMVAKDLPYPTGVLSADDIIEQTYFVNHFYGFKNFAITKKRSKRFITSLTLRAKGSRPLTLTLERYLNNDYKANDTINSKDLAIFRSGKLKGTGMLITDFVDQDKSQTYEIFIPSIRKVRRFAQPAMDDAWGGSDFTFGDVTLRKPKHETHSLLDTTTMNACLGILDLPVSQRNKYTQRIKMQKDCSVIGKKVYNVKSTPKATNWWYDYRISLIDQETFVDYSTKYYKDGNHIKTIVRSWKSAGLADPRSNYWGYWYGMNIDTGHETMAFVPNGITKFNHKYRTRNLWSTRTLRKMPRKIR